MRDLPGRYSSSGSVESDSSAAGITLAPFFTTHSRLLLRGGLKGFGAGSRRPLEFCAVTMSRLPPQQWVWVHTKPASSTQIYNNNSLNFEQKSRRARRAGLRVRERSGQSRTWVRAPEDMGSGQSRESPPSTCGTAEPNLRGTSTVLNFYLVALEKHLKMTPT